MALLSLLALLPLAQAAQNVFIPFNAKAQEQPVISDANDANPGDHVTEVDITLCEVLLVAHDSELDVKASQYSRSYLLGADVACSNVIMDASTLSVGGPTIKVKPGDQMRITLFNNLPASNRGFEWANTQSLNNTYHDVHITGLHTHGLHISGEAPGDSIFTSVYPKGSDPSLCPEYDEGTDPKSCSVGSHTFNYSIPADHMGGTFWYHPHHHGSTALQAGGGAAGMIIVEDMPGDLPTVVAEMEEHVMSMISVTFINNHDIARSGELVCKCKVGTCDACTEATKNKCKKTCKNPGGGPGFAGSLAGFFNTLPGVSEGDFLACPVGDRNATVPAAKQHELELKCQEGVGGGVGVWAPGLATDGLSEGTPEQRHKFLGESNMVLMNGAFNPEKEIVANTWHRFRMLYSSVDKVVMPTIEGGGCEYKLLAKDGITLQSAPRNFETGFMGPGNRADWLVRCKPGKHRLITQAYVPFGGDLLQLTGETKLYGPGPNVRGNHYTREAQNLVTLVATVDGSAPATPSCEVLPTFEVARPCYLVDLQREPSTSFSMHDDTKIGVTLGLKVGNSDISGLLPPNYYVESNESSYSNTLDFDGMHSVDAKPPIGQPIELDLHGLYFHAFHLHVNPFQLQGDPVLADATAAIPNGNSGGAIHANFEEKKTGAFADYFRAGDWHDTLMLPTRNSLTVRSQTDKFTGSQIFHCHILDHEDLGMMGQFLIQEGPDAEWAGARRIDPRCYNASSVERGGARPFARIVDPGSCAAAEAYPATPPFPPLAPPLPPAAPPPPPPPVNLVTIVLNLVTVGIGLLASFILLSLYYYCGCFCGASGGLCQSGHHPCAGAIACWEVNEFCCQNYGIGRRDIPDAAKRDVEIAKVEIDVEVEITTGEAIRPVAPQAPSGMAEREVV